MIDELYSARILGLAANLPHSGRLATPEGTGERVARLCGSKAIVDVTLDDAGLDVLGEGFDPACALGQAAAGVLGEVVIGTSLDELVAARDAMSAMLKAGGEGPTGRFEGLRALKQVADYPARHASTMVAVEATVDAVRAALARKGPDTRTSLAGAA